MIPVLAIMPPAFEHSVGGFLVIIMRVRWCESSRSNSFPIHGTKVDVSGYAIVDPDQAAMMVIVRLKS